MNDLMVYMFLKLQGREGGCASLHLSDVCSDTSILILG